MKNELAMQKLKTLVYGLRDEDTNQRLNTYATIIVIMNRLRETNKTAPNIETYLAELLWSCEALCGLDDGNNRPEEDHIVWAVSAIEKIYSIHCLNT